MTMEEKLMISEDEKVCFNCKHFCQHYIYTTTYRGMGYSPCNAGHCVEARIKDRKPKHRACEHFEWKNGDSDV